jgi:hypothetical protein
VHMHFLQASAGAWLLPHLLCIAYHTCGPGAAREPCTMCPFTRSAREPEHADGHTFRQHPAHLALDPAHLPLPASPSRPHPQITFNWAWSKGPLSGSGYGDLNLQGGSLDEIFLVR